MERISIKRSLDSVDGKLINYLNSGPLGMSSTEAILLALRAYWLPLALKKHGQSIEDVHSSAAWAIPNLQAQANTISINCKIELGSAFVSATPVTQVQASTPLEQNLPQPQLQQPDKEDDEDNWGDEENWGGDFQLSEEMVAMNNTLRGVE
jgi:hypothetical protein